MSGYTNVSNMNIKQKKKNSRKVLIILAFLWFLLSFCSLEYEIMKMNNLEKIWHNIIIIGAPLFLIALKNNDNLRIDSLHYFYTAWQVLACWSTNSKLGSILFITGVFVCYYSWHTKGTCYISEMVYDESKTEEENHFIRSDWIKRYNIPDWYLLIASMFLFQKIKDNNINIFSLN